MNRTPFDIGTVHFVGIGGIGMSGIAEVMHTLGYRVQGSDASDSPNLDRLRALGVPVFIGHAAEHVANAGTLVVSSAIREGNPEVAAARARFVPVVRRAEMLAELMRLKWSIAVGGTHGKTTTTSMIAAVLDAARFDPTVINGGIINAYATNARLGSGEWMVVEADESDGSFVKLPATVAVVTNIDPEHLDFYGDFDALRDAFLAFVSNIPFYGFVVANIDHPEVQALISQLPDRRVVTYGVSPQADLRAANIAVEAGGSVYDVFLGDRMRGETRLFRALRLPMPGRHNVLNSLAAIAIACELGIDETVIRRALEGFGGVKRRFTRTGVWNGVTIVDDYGHHPVEIAAVLDAARSVCAGRVVAVVQPHRYSRLARLFEEFCTCFNGADAVLVADVYAAGEAPIAGIDRDALVQGLRSHGHRHAIALEAPEALPERIAELVQPGDMVVCLGAGSITRWAQALPEQLAARFGPDMVRRAAS